MIDRQSEIFIPDLLFKVSFFKRIDLWQFLAMHVKSFKVFHCSVIKVLIFIYDLYQILWLGDSSSNIS